MRRKGRDVRQHSVPVDTVPGVWVILWSTMTWQPFYGQRRKKGK